MRTPRTGSILALLLCCCALACGGGSGGASAARPNVFLVLMDAASAFHYGPWGGEADTSPNIDALARDWVVFENAYSQSATTVPSTASLITGVRVTTHLMNTKTTLPDEFRTAAEILGESGYRGFAYIGNPWAGSPKLGFHRGYEDTVLVYLLPELLERRQAAGGTFAGPYPGDLNRPAFSMLDELPRQGAFVHLHYLQPHEPYNPPDELLADFLPAELEPSHPLWTDWKSAYAAMRTADRKGEVDADTLRILEARYRANIHFVDEALGALVERLREQGLYDEALILLTSDHGDAFFKHRRFGHNSTLYDDMARIPLMIKFPASAGIEAKRLSNPVETIDLLPTILDYLGIEAPAHLEGDSLWPLIQGRSKHLGEPEVILATMARDTHAIRLGDFKYILDTSGREQLYDLVSDPDEQNDLIVERPELARDLRARLEAKVDLRTGRKLVETEDLHEDPDLARLLESLGYTDTGEPREGQGGE